MELQVKFDFTGTPESELFSLVTSFKTIPEPVYPGSHIKLGQCNQMHAVFCRTWFGLLVVSVFYS